MSNLIAVRIYDEIPDDYYKVLVDGLWPRGFKKETPKVDEWLKEIAPSNDLRKWYGHDMEKAGEFTDKYEEELLSNVKALDKLRNIIKEHKRVALIYAAKAEVNNATVLRDFLKQ